MEWKRKILSSEAETQLENKIGELETKSHVEVAVAIMRACDPYPAASLRFALIGTFAFSLFLVSSFTFAHPAYFVVMQFFVLICLGFLGKMYWAKQACLSQGEVEREVAEKANEIFFTMEMHELQSKSMILMLFSLQERRIKIIVGPALRGLVSDQDTDAILSVVQKEFKNKNYHQGIAQALDYIEQRVMAAAPQQRDKNASKHFSNKIIWGDFS